MTTIREHIEAGRYPLDEKGRPKVPFLGRDPEVSYAVIAATDAPGEWPLMGWCVHDEDLAQASWFEDGCPGSEDAGFYLAPPPPKIVEVVQYAVVSPSGNVWSVHPTPEAANKKFGYNLGLRVVELTGSFEVPW